MVPPAFVGVVSNKLEWSAILVGENSNKGEVDRLLFSGHA